MLIARVGQVAREDFSVLDLSGNLLSGIAIGTFTYHLYDPSGALSAVTVSFVELGNGHYRASFTPNATGEWYLIVYHATYFPAGKSGTIKAYDEDIDTAHALVESVQTLAQAVYDIEYGRWHLDGNTMIFYKEDNATEIARFTITRDAELVPIERTRI